MFSKLKESFKANPQFYYAMSIAGEELLPDAENVVEGDFVTWVNDEIINMTAIIVSETDGSVRLSNITH